MPTAAVLRTLVAAAALATLPGIARAACGTSGMQLGFNLAGTVYGYTADPSSFLRDLVVMKSFGARTIRVFYLPCETGFTLRTGMGGGVVDRAKIAEVVAKTKTVLQYLAFADMKAVVNFDFLPYYVHLPPLCAGVQWTDAYPNTPAGWNAFVADGTSWVKGIVAGLEASGLAGSILYYDLVNELHYPTGITQDDSKLLRSLLTNVPTGPGRRGVSLLLPCQVDTPGGGPNLLLDLQATGKTLDFIDTHAYPESDYALEPTCGTDDARYDRKLALLSAAYPSACLVAGEFASDACKVGETTAGAHEMTLLDQAEAAGARHAFHWWLWDGATSCTPGAIRWGLGSDRDHPYDTLGRWADRFSRIAGGGDFETAGSDGGWSVGGPATVKARSRRGPSASQAATGAWHLRMTANGDAWLCSPQTTGFGGTRVALSAYVRTNSANGALGLDVHWWKAGQTGTVSRTIGGLSNAAFRNVQSTVDNGFVFDVPSGTTAVSVCFVGTRRTGCDPPDLVVDVDGVSLQGF